MRWQVNKQEKEAALSAGAAAARRDFLILTVIAEVLTMQIIFALFAQSLFMAMSGHYYFTVILAIAGVSAWDGIKLEILSYLTWSLMRYKTWGMRRRVQKKFREHAKTCPECMEILKTRKKHEWF